MPLQSNDRRSRATSTASTPNPGDEGVYDLVHRLTSLDLSSWDSLDHDLAQSSCVQELRFTLKEEGGEHNPQDAFRRARGFQATVTSIKCLAGVWDQAASAGKTKTAIQTLSQLLAVLEAAIVQHTGNNRYFGQRVAGGGWLALEDILLRMLRSIMQHDSPMAHAERFFGVLFATATGNEAVSDMYANKGKAGNVEKATIQNYIEKAMIGVNTVALPDMLAIFASIWSKFRQTEQVPAIFQLTIPISLKILLDANQQNVISANAADLFSRIRFLLFEPKLSRDERDIFRHVALCLSSEGISRLEDVHAVVQKAYEDPAAAEFLLNAIRTSRHPPSIQFDLSKHGSSSAELANLRRPFPSTDLSSTGYTLALWARFDQFDPNAHTTLFGAFDKSHACFVLAYLEKDSRHLILQTAIRGAKPSVRFKSVTFQPGCWYHICITHKKPRVTSSSKASLFVDGEFVEQVKATFPASAPIDRASGTIKVQAFLGTPQDLSPDTGHRACLSRWRLSSAILYDDVLSDDLMAVMYHLGPRYYGNMQDCLGSFQTYRASAELNLRNESLNPGKEEASDLMMAIRHKASNLVHENKILLNISAPSVFDDEDRNNVDESQLIQSLSKTAAKNLSAYTRTGANSIAINGAVPAINAALVQTNGIAMLMGEPTVSVPRSLDDAIFCLGGCSPVGLSLLQQARTTEDVARATEILLETIRDNWRNSEVMERDSGYGIFCNIIREKLFSQSDSGRAAVAIPTPNLDRNGLALRLLRSILTFVGYDFEDESKSIIINALAYRILLVDSSIWRTYSYETQEFFFKQIIAFATTSFHSRFNIKRLNRMRVLKRLLEALKGEPVSRQIMPYYSAALKALLPHAMTAEMLRSVALFINFCIHKRTSVRQRKATPSESRSRASSSGSFQGTPATPIENNMLSHIDVGLEILRLYSDMLCKKGETVLIKKFAKTVTNKWLLYLLSESAPEVVVLSTRILARLLVVHGENYVRKFKERSGGFTIMCHRLKRWWHLPALWPVCFAVLFGVDVADLDLERPFDLFGFIELFNSRDHRRIAYPDMFEVIMRMLQSGLRTIASSQEGKSQDRLLPTAEPSLPQTPQRLSMSTMAPPNPSLTLVTPQHIETFKTIVKFLADMQLRSANFREFAMSSTYIQDLLYVMFPVIVGSDIVEATVELNARDSVLSFDGMDMIVHPLTKSSSFTKESPSESRDLVERSKPLRRGSSFVLVARDSRRTGPTISNERVYVQDDAPISSIQSTHENNTLVQAILELVISSFIEQLFAKKEFPGLGLFLKTPPGFVEHQHYFESWILSNTVSQLANAIAMKPNAICEPRVITNLSKFFTHLGEAIFEGWFVGGAESVLELAGSTLEYLQRSDVAQLKSVRLCTQPISSIRTVVFRIVILGLSQSYDQASSTFLTKLGYWQNVLLSSDDAQSTYLQHICYLLYCILVSTDGTSRSVAADMWRIILVQKPEDANTVLDQVTSVDGRDLITNFKKQFEQDNGSLLMWIDENRDKLDSLVSSTLSKQWDAYVVEENRRIEDTARSRISRRREKLKSLARDEADREDLIRRHETTFDHWTSNIYSSETLKHQRLMQDQQDDRLFLDTTFRRMQRELGRTTRLTTEETASHWRLDQTEGRNRMRMRLVEDFDHAATSMQPKQKGSETPSLKIDVKVARAMTSATPITPSAKELPTAANSRMVEGSTEPFPDMRENDGYDPTEIDESFEIVEDPNGGEDEFEDKNRKVMRSLHRGDQVKNVVNISRIVGLEAIESLMILGKDYIYLIDNFFQRKDGEIVNVWQAPQKERDPYVKVISGRDVALRRPQSGGDEHEARSWKWSEIISVSKRRFLFRDVAIEIFFADGRSYLLTMISTNLRNDFFSRINNKAPQYNNEDSAHSEFAWRYESLKSAEEEPQTLGARLTNVFAQSSVLTATKKWQKGEMSNFHYLMLINTMAGRTYNDLTQYPVFPWVLADYKNDELDLSDPKTFRDLSKPMGCQTQEREAVFRDRYKSFAEMGDHNAPAFHYGTHYSSAMIVTSYLIRLEPFIQSYLLLQGGTFDHPDRMFFSIEQAWRSASAINMTDVRELTPEFFYLPEFLTNPNGYDFGTRQNSNKSIGNVELPPWAKGDPRVFIAKQREALESPYVSANLHKWIDLVFGCKQKGEAAQEAVNVFHHLSYQGAKDLDAITDPVERLATIGIIHNFGQTPHQVFQKAHPARENAQHRYKRLDTAAESLTRLPSTLLDSDEKVASLTYVWRSDRLLCSGAFRLNIPPLYDKYMEWGFFDGSIRFYLADTRKQVGLFEHLHIGQLSSARFVDSKTLITAGVDCTVAVWTVVHNGKAVELHPRATLFGHTRPVTGLALSQSFNALLSFSSSGEMMMWDLNRCEYVRRIQTKTPIPISCASINDVTGNIVVCYQSLVSIYSLNGDLLLSQETCDRNSTSADDHILSVTCYEGAGTEWLERDIIFTGHGKGVVKVWSKIVSANTNASQETQSPFELELIRQLNHVDSTREDGANVNAGISCILAMPQVVYTGDEDGHVYEWNCVQRH